MGPRAPLLFLPLAATVGPRRVRSTRGRQFISPLPTDKRVVFRCRRRPARAPPLLALVEPVGRCIKASQRPPNAPGKTTLMAVMDTSINQAHFTAVPARSSLLLTTIQRRKGVFFSQFCSCRVLLLAWGCSRLGTYPDPGKLHSSVLGGVSRPNSRRIPKKKKQRGGLCSRRGRRNPASIGNRS